MHAQCCTRRGQLRTGRRRKPEFCKRLKRKHALWATLGYTKFGGRTFYDSPHAPGAPAKEYEGGANAAFAMLDYIYGLISYGKGPYVAMGAGYGDTSEPIAKLQFCNSNGVGRLHRACGAAPDGVRSEAGRVFGASCMLRCSTDALGVYLASGARPCTPSAAPDAASFVPGTDVSPSFARGSSVKPGQTDSFGYALGGSGWCSSIGVGYGFTKNLGLEVSGMAASTYNPSGMGIRVFGWNQASLKYRF
jgi:hypothetical protein